MKTIARGLSNWPKPFQNGLPTDVSRIRVILHHSYQRALGNSSAEMDHLNTLLQKWLPGQQRVAVDSTPRLHGIWDTINSTLATSGPPTRLPPEFYCSRARNIIDRIVTVEEYSGFKECAEYRAVGIGALLGEVVQRMVHSSQEKESSASSRGGLDSKDLTFRTSLRIALFGCHDSTLAASLAALGALEGENNTWPSYTSSLAVELFRDSEQAQSRQKHRVEPKGRLAHGLQHYVRIRYNDCPITIPGCRPQGRHFDGDESICTLVS